MLLCTRCTVIVIVDSSRCVQASAPLFLLGFAFLFRLEKPSARLFGIMIIISIGLLFTIKGEIKVRFFGIIIALGSAIVAGLRWNLMQLIMYK